MVKGKNEAELEAAAKAVVTEFNDYNGEKWSYSIAAEAVQTSEGKVQSWNGTVKATRSP